MKKNINEYTLEPITSSTDTEFLQKWFSIIRKKARKAERLDNLIQKAISEANNATVINSQDSRGII